MLRCLLLQPVHLPLGCLLTLIIFPQSRHLIIFHHPYGVGIGIGVDKPPLLTAVSTA